MPGVNPSMPRALSRGARRNATRAASPPERDADASVTSVLPAGRGTIPFFVSSPRGCARSRDQGLFRNQAGADEWSSRIAITRSVGVEPTVRADLHMHARGWGGGRADPHLARSKAEGPPSGDTCSCIGSGRVLGPVSCVFGMLRAVPYDPTIYRGAAAHYRYGRPPYSPQLEPLLAKEARLDGRGRLLDAGCGPGILTIRLAPLVGEVVGLDPDPDMLAEGSRAAEGKGLRNIRWVQALAEDLPAAAPGPYRLVTFGQSFHWTNEERVAEAIYDMLEPGGSLALIVHTVTGRPRPPSPGPPPIPHEEIRMLVARHLGSTRRAGQGFTEPRAHRFQDVLVRTRFGEPRVLFLPGVPDLVRDSESVLSGYFSLASSAPHLFPDVGKAFAQDVRALLTDRSPEGLFWDWPGDTEVVLAHSDPQ
jgi:SAM-dependent methyltransferase